MRIAILALCVTGMLLSATSAKADKRVAFVAGNGTYTHVEALPNPPVDAKAMAGLLRNNGFDVVEGYNLGRDGMAERLRTFAAKTQGADIAVFFYAGHGIAVDGKNYLIPVDADLNSEMDVRLGAAIDVDVSLDQTMSDAKVKLVFLDACRDNPFAAKIRSAARSRSVVIGSGLAEMKSGEGTLIAFATGPGQTALDGKQGTNSPFTRALLANLATPGVEIQQAMTRVRAQVSEETNKQQLPWGHTNLTGSVYINPVATASADPAGSPSGPAPIAAAPGASDVELEFWRSIKDSNKTEELNAYLTNYPNGQFRSIALARIAALQAQPNPETRNLTVGPDPAVFTADATQLTEDQIGLDRNQRKAVQRKLNNLGFDTKSTGTFDDATRAVIKRWQAARGYPSTGYLNRFQDKALMAESAPDHQDEADTPSEAHESKHSSGRRHANGGGGGGGGGGGRPPDFFGAMMHGAFGR